MDVIGRYRLRDKIGAGAFATVWRGYDDDLDVDVAVKVLADNWASRADVRERFLSEARLMRRISSDRVVRVFDLGRLPDGRPYFVMDYVGGGTLGDVLRGGTVEPVDALWWGADLARAVAALHYEGVVHRDVTPANLLLRENQGIESGGGTHRIVLADLGLAKRAAEASGLTQAVGTPAYMAPEQGRGDGGFDERADIYAIGAVTYALLTGRPPYSAGSIGDVLNRDPDQPPPSLRPLLHDAVGALDDVLARALAYNPVDRFERAELLAERLEAEAYRLEQEAPLRAQERTSITADEVSTTVATNSPVRRRRRLWLWFAVSLPLFFVAAGAGGWYLFGQ
ncbi:serine/threonine protein kinase [Kribbella sandramycini]|uniref:non-specific serine/threonine protein kinase n=1 Tax=Kribbella sandramycini TaxID=60450 RepID=A0A7Y4L5D3_9ACTN|nr:serine/threonine-protein kinase [Kribbella sandramycini]MBB6566972.1 serine/threonine protein kinase [Kribbella sandramycini]NOL44694.1 serine/threonine protein kinase [Kribbella sandramycini]